jgi:CrcB protein
MATQIASIAIGGAIGAVARFLVYRSAYSLFGTGLPWGTLAVNVLGSLAMGYLFVRLESMGEFEPVVRATLQVGLLGAFTTFSTFSIETIALLEVHAYTRAIANVILSVGLCLAACALGIWVARHA